MCSRTTSVNRNRSTGTTAKLRASTALAVRQALPLALLDSMIGGGNGKGEGGGGGGGEGSDEGGGGEGGCEGGGGNGKDEGGGGKAAARAAGAW